MRILVIGAGVLGSLYAARLALAGEQVWALARGARLVQLQQNPLLLIDDASGDIIKFQMPLVSSLSQQDVYDLVLVTVRAEDLDGLLSQLTKATGARLFLFMHNRAAGDEAIASSLGADRYLLGFPGACGAPEGDAIRYRLIPEQATTLGEPDGRMTPRLRKVAAIFRKAGFPTTLTGKMNDWLKAHALLVTAIVGAIYEAGGSASRLAAQPDQIATFVRAVRQGFGGLTEAGVTIVPRKLRLLFALPEMIPRAYWRAYLGRAEAELMFAAHARRAVGEMAALVADLRSLMPADAAVRPDLESLWAAVDREAAVARAGLLSH